jgi:hypothetical protein
MLTRRRLIALTASQEFAPNFFIRKGRAPTSNADFPNINLSRIAPAARLIQRNCKRKHHD